MPIRESSFRIGSGRYLQGENILTEIGNEVLRLGTLPLIVGDTTALSITRETIEKSIASACKKYEIIVHDGTCNHERAREIAEMKESIGYDVIIGVGGGVIMDFAKLCADYAACPIINVPTSSATCACYTPLSVCYTPDGKTVGTTHFKREVDAVIADTAILVRQPVRLLLSGVFDALAKFIEIRHRYRENDAIENIPLGLDYAYALSCHSYRILTEDTADCIADMEKGIVSARFERLIFTALAATGVISGIARGSNQTALAHKFYEITRTLYPTEARPYLHGEIVGVGLILQNKYNGEEERNASLIALMKKHKMPCLVTDVAIEPTEEIKAEYESRLQNSSSIDKENAEECRRLRTSLDYLFGMAY